MHPILVYILQVNFALVLFYLLFTLLFKRDTFLKIRRFYFLSALLFSVIYPLLVVPGLSDFWNFRFSEPQTVEATVFFEAPTLEVMVEESEAEAASLNIPWEQIFITLYIAVTIFFILRFLWQLISIFRIRLKSEETEVLGIKVYDLKDNITPFSFFGMIFINSEMHSKEELEQIIIHEHTHVSEKHSLDIMLVESILLFSWWNPAVWLLKREMAMNLEYLADVGVLREGVDSREYQYHLLRLTYHETAVQIVNNFNVSQLKQRIMMMNKTRSSSLKLAKYLTILPIFFILIAANSSYAGEKDQSLQEPPPVKKEVTEEIFVVVEQQPEYPGGQEAMMKFLSDSIVYPEEAKAKGIQGRVICNYVVMKDGSIDDVNVVRGVDPLLDAEAVRVLKSMPAWKPGKQRGQAVNVRYTLPVVFRISAEDSQNKLLTTEDRNRMTDGEKGDQKVMPEPSEVFVVVEQQPEYPGGLEAMMKFLSESIVYPDAAKAKGIQGRVICNFVVMKDGSIDDVNVVRGVDPLLDAEAVRVLKSMPAWKPGKQRGQAVNVRYTLPLEFRLDNKPLSEEKKEELQRIKDSFVEAEFPGGESAYFKYLTESIKYPVIAQENGIQGLVLARYRILSNGKVEFIDITNGADPLLGREVQRIIEGMPDWTPSRIDGKGTTSVATLTVQFRLQGDNTKPYDGPPLPENAIVVVGYAS
ncbi:MAG: M56 family metallopeptidase [Lascolabacillus sp.]|uniref:M56 family metallopeptidase n=1 Tax=Lascolabacillus sp. TaxID=1924068 RepID=UPI002586AFF1|nr:M56 family metallopeptidase [Lascolabacillus sp.]MDD4758836.1 M56 family metallopeptidase [Lascolabacillus sp.]